jgi:hypothetical protein
MLRKQEMNRLIQTCFSLRDDQIQKYGRAYSVFGVGAGLFFLMMAIVLVACFGIRMEPIDAKVGQICDQLLQQANITSEVGTVVATRDTAFLRKMGDFIKMIPFLGALFLSVIGVLFLQCGLLYQKAKTRESPTSR